MRKALYFGATLLVLCALNALIVQKEVLKSSGQVLYLQLDTADNALVMGNAVRMVYDFNRTARPAVNGNGFLVVKLDEHNVGTFARIHAGEPLAADERLLLYREQYGVVQVGPPMFDIPAGRSSSFSRAKFGELRVSKSGDCLLVGLCDENRTPLVR